MSDAELDRDTRDFYGDILTRDRMVSRLLRYPNEELHRFITRGFCDVPRAERRRMRVLEVGFGWGANLWMLDHEGFDAYGIDLSWPAPHVCRATLRDFGAAASLAIADMRRLPFAAAVFDGVFDIFSGHCFDEKGCALYLDEVARVTRPGGFYFVYTPSQLSAAFQDYHPAKKLDASTLDGISRETSPFFGNRHPHRFSTSEGYAASLQDRGFEIGLDEIVTRTYQSRRETFAFVVISARKVA